MPRYSSRAWGFFTLIACLAAGCQGADSAAPPTTGWAADTLRLGQRSDFRSLDPAIANDTALVPIVRTLFQPLLDYDDGVNIVPLAAAAMPTLSKDGHTYTFLLRKDVKFSNGRDVTADDYLYAWQRVLDPKTKSPWVSFLTSRVVGAQEYADEKATTVSGLRAPDPYTLEVELNHPDLTFLYVVAMPFLAPVPREEIEKYPVEDRNEEFALHPIGNGPFRLVEWRRGLRMRLERDPNYWGPHPAGLAKINVMFGLDDLTMQMMFERGELDLMDRIPSPAYVRLRKDLRWKPDFEKLVFNGVYYLNLNCEMPPFNGPNGKKVRQAFNYAINKERLVQIGNGRYEVAKGVVPPNMPDYHYKGKTYSYDPERAKELLAEAGYSDGISKDLTLWLSNEGSGGERMAEAIQEDLKKVNVTVELNPVNYATFLPAAAKRGNVAFSMSGWFQDYPDPSDFLDVLFSSHTISEEENNNMAFYNSAKADELMDAADLETNPQKRMGLYEQAEEEIMEDAPVVPLVDGVEIWLHQSWVKGFALHPVWLVRYEKLSISPP